MGPNGNGARSVGGWVPRRQKLEKVVIRFAGDSGDGMQLTGDRFTSEAALFGNDLATQPNYPAEIRAPQGTLPGVSSFQIQIADYDILTAGDRPDVLVAMNPAALKANIGDLPRGGVVIANSDEFTKRNLAKVGYDGNPMDGDELSDYFVHAIPMTTLTLGAVESIGASKKDGQRAKNMFALGLLCWMYGREVEPQETFIREKFGRKPDVAEANVLALRAGWNYGETTEAFGTTYEVAPAKLAPGEYRQISGNSALAYGIIVAGQLADTRIVLGSYPITPASDILHELSKHKNFNVITFQAEDEIAGIGAALGASYGGALGVTSTSGPGISLKSEAIGLGVMTELPLLVIDVQRGGPSTGLPTKTEQADLLQAMFGRNGESPVAIVAPQSPADCFDAALEATRIALTYRTPVLLLSDGYIANGSEPWLIPNVDDLPDLTVKFATEPNGEDGQYLPYLRDADTLARPWAVPGTPGLEHRIGGLEKDAVSGNVSYDALNHERMVHTRSDKVAHLASGYPPIAPAFDASGDVLVIGWGSSHGSITQAIIEARAGGLRVGHLHLRHIFPLPSGINELAARYRHVLIPELNLGQLRFHLRGQLGLESVGLNKVQGKPFHVAEVRKAIESLARRDTETGREVA
ncbi:MAG: 2-oxoacid:acceptor oxidoreductase subunit alpha [Mycobacteriaceae bacterium]|nr:2-oxoacid:acceptor oxidoreductase subunit alpha [Mycobacteriaceae bacterium]